MARWRIRAGNQQTGLGQLCLDQRQYGSCEPFERDLIRHVAKTAQEQHSVRRPRTARERILRRLDTRSHARTDAPLEARKKALNVTPILFRADLYVIAFR